MLVALLPSAHESRAMRHSDTASWCYIPSAVSESACDTCVYWVHSRFSGAEGAEGALTIQLYCNSVTSSPLPIHSDMHKDLCRGVSGLCDAMRPTKGADLLRYLRKVNFTGLSGDRFHFNNNGDGPARYNIIHFKQVEKGKYRWIKVGEYYEGELRLNMSGKDLYRLSGGRGPSPQSPHSLFPFSLTPALGLPSLPF